MEHLWLIPALPLLGFLIVGILGRRLAKPAINAVAIGSVLLSLLWVVKSLHGLWPIDAPHVDRYFDWIDAGGLRIGFDFAVDRLTAVMLLVVTGVGLLIHIYATGYMAHDTGYARFFAYLNLFMFFMLTLVLAANFLLMFVGWEGVGLSSYLLIGFWFRKRSATNAGNKAFIVNRIGDFGFSLAIFLLAVNFHSLDFQTVFSGLAGWPVEQSVGTLTLVGFLLLLGAAGKSAQIPLYVWLPDAMEGPTPVSALIHAATMVTAGVYMIARAAPLYLKAPIALDLVAIVGLATAFFAATIGLAQNDIKKVFAYSTVSQLGYMFLGLGAGAFSAGVFHLVTHAFFKALLFLGAGSVIHALAGEQDLRRMGGLRKKIPITFCTLCAASLSIAGFPGTAGFFSKDEILVAAYRHAPWMYWVAVVTAGMTAFYVFRALFLAFFGEYRGDAHPHESPRSMTLPLIALAALSIFGGLIPVPHWLEPLFPAAETKDFALGAIAAAAGLAGIALAFLFYVARPSLASAAAHRLGWLYRTVANKYYVDEIYNAAIVGPTLEVSRSVLLDAVDIETIDATVNGVAARARGVGGILRQMQSGYIRSYAAWVLLGAVAVLIAMGFSGGAR